MNKKFKNFKEFYPFYLSEHSQEKNRKMHFIGTSLLILVLLYALLTQNYKMIFICPLLGYGFAWVGHFYFEKNKPATFKYPFYSFMGDFVMFFELLTKRIKFNSNT